MTKALRKGIMKRSELESNYVKNNTNENLKSYENVYSSIQFNNKQNK